MNKTEYQTLLNNLLPIAYRAGDAIMAEYNSATGNVQHKDDQSPVTAADLAAHRILVEDLTKLSPQFPVVSEEDAKSHAVRLNTATYWLIDPLDGTKEYIARNGEFTVNIALIENGQSVLGVVYAPAIQSLYWGGAQFGAFRRIGNQTDKTAPIKVGDSTAGACRVVASKSHLNEATQSLIDKLGKVDLVQAGSSLKFCRVAENQADIYPRLAPTCEWDTAAAQAILEGAGGLVLDLQGNSLQYGKTNILNPSFIATRDVALIPA